MFYLVLDGAHFQVQVSMGVPNFPGHCLLFKCKIQMCYIIEYACCTFFISSVWMFRERTVMIL